MDNPNISLYERLGGDATIRQLCQRFYHYMDTLPETKNIRELHPKDLSVSEEKLYEFLSGWSGGPQLYMKKYGHPRLRMRHMPFQIGAAERDEWLLCMEKALDDIAIDDELKLRLRKNFEHIADFMRNREDETIS